MDIGNLQEKANAGNRSNTRFGSGTGITNDLSNDAAKPSNYVIDLNELLISNKSTTFFFRMNGNAMIDAGIFEGDILLVDRSVINVNGKVIIAFFNGELLVRRLEKKVNITRLIPENASMQAVEVKQHHCFNVWGVVTFNIHSL